MPARHLGVSLCDVQVFGDDGGLRHYDTGAGVLKLGVDADVFSLTEALPVDPSADGHLAVWDEHTGDLLLFGGCSWSLVEDSLHDNHLRQR